VVDGFESVFAESGPFLTVDYFLDDSPMGPPAFAEYFVAILLAFAMRVVPEDPVPTEIVFAHADPCFGGALQARYGDKVRYGGGSVRFVFPKTRLQLSIVGSDPHLGRLIARTAAASMPSSEGLRDRIRRFLSEKLDEGEPIDGTILPRAFGMSERSLRRRLRGEGTSSREIVNDVRHDGALRLLRNDRVSLDEVAFRLGFSGSSAFRRAFRRWTGRSPASYRAGLVRGR
jgi:AraC-like DNA-binding protein